MKKLLVTGTVSAAVLLSASPAQAAGVDLSPVVNGLTKLLSAKGQPNTPAQAPPPAAVPPPLPVPDVASVVEPLPPLPPVPELPLGPVAESLNVVPVGPERQVLSTAYCLTGRMASGKPVYEGAAAMNGVPLGSKFKVADGPRAGEVFTIEDRMPRSGGLNIAYPGDCGQAQQYGRRSVRINEVALTGAAPAQ